jgi:hypothetical protein
MDYVTNGQINEYSTRFPYRVAENISQIRFTWSNPGKTVSFAQIKSANKCQISNFLKLKMTNTKFFQKKNYKFSQINIPLFHLHFLNKCLNFTFHFSPPHRVAIPSVPFPNILTCCPCCCCPRRGLCPGANSISLSSTAVLGPGRANSRCFSISTFPFGRHFSSP